MSKRLLRCFILMTSLIATGHSKKTRSHVPSIRVVQGWSAGDNEYPFVVSLLSKTLDWSNNINYLKNLVYFRRSCTGSLLNSQFVLTAAHCMNPMVEYVRCGNMTLHSFKHILNEIKCKSKILKQFLNPGIIETMIAIENDIGLIQIEPLIVKSYGRLRAVDYKSLLGSAVRYAGYGMVSVSMGTKENFDLEEKPLQIGEGVIYDTYNKKSRYYSNLNPVVLIAPKCSKRDQHPYFGDSGGPLFVGGHIAGVASFVSRIKDESDDVLDPVMSGYTPVSPYLEWISHTIKKGSNSRRQKHKRKSWYI